MLKTQLRLYVDDFQNERSDRERAQAEKQKLNEELNAVKDQILVLEAQVTNQLTKHWLLVVEWFLENVYSVYLPTQKNHFFSKLVFQYINLIFKYMHNQRIIDSAVFYFNSFNL